jgi:DNA replication and repair protein RecF
MQTLDSVGFHGISGRILLPLHGRSGCWLLRRVIRSLRAVDFRCFSLLDLQVPAQGGLFTGQNAQGKTSILEAVCVLTRLQSPRTHRMSSLARKAGSGSFGIAGEAWASERRLKWQGTLELQVDGEPRAGSGEYLSDGGLIVWMGNEDLELVRGPAENRRRYLDFIGVQIEPGYRPALARYKRALKAKNLLLKAARQDLREIESYEAILITSAEVLHGARARLIEQLGPLAAAAQCEVSGIREILALNYVPSGGMNLAVAIEQAREKELRLRQTLVGPHRDDLALAINGLAANEFASEGQQRTLALALKLAQGQALTESQGRMPVYLIDDIFGELDVQRRNALLGLLPTEAQKWITTTHLDWLRDSTVGETMARYHVEAGSIRES